MRWLTALHHCDLKGDITFSGKKKLVPASIVQEKNGALQSPIPFFLKIFIGVELLSILCYFLCVCVCVCVCVCSVAQLCLTLCNPMECSPPGSSVHKIFQARKLEWVAILPSRRSSQPRDQTRDSCVDRCFFPLCHLGIPVLVSAVKQSESVICIHISPLFQISFPFKLSQRIEQGSLHYTVGSRQLSMIFYTQQCICQSQSPNSSHHTPQP